MPEMPEVEIIRCYLDEKLTGRRIESVDIRLPRQLKYPSPAEFQVLVTGQEIAGMRRRGKYLALELMDGARIIFHLRMTGHLVYHTETEIHDRYARMIFYLDKGTLVYGDTRTLGVIYGLSADETPTASPLLKGLATMGPEPLSAEFTAAYLYEKTRLSRMHIKSFLLDQKKIGGIGNIYADEALFVARLHPLRLAMSLSEEECQRLQAAVNEVIAAGIADGGTTFRDYQNGAGGQGHHQEKLNVYNRKGLPCPVCGTPIEKMTIGGRGAHFCPHCQAVPEA